MSHVFEAAPRRTVWDWICSHQKFILIGAIVFQMIVLVSMIAQSARPLVTGDTILLRVIPVDPRDIFRGDYVILAYDFTTQRPTGELQFDQAIVGREIFVSLVPEDDGKHWRTESVSWSQPESGTYLRGTVDQSMRNEFGIGQYFVQEGQGKEYENAVLSRRLSAEVAVTPDGAATLRRLIVE
jgi:uncharacterized membrane-anchored protein